MNKNNHALIDLYTYFLIINNINQINVRISLVDINILPLKNEADTITVVYLMD
jgi:hypothetical protein